MTLVEDIHKAFRQRAKALHPDRFPLGSAEHERATEEFKLLQLARDTLMDPVLREEYDAEQDVIQQAHLSALVYEFPVQKREPQGPSFKETLKDAFEKYEEQSEELPADAKAKKMAEFYYSQGTRLAARGFFRQAFHFLSHARRLNPELPISETFFNRVKLRAYSSKR